MSSHKWLSSRSPECRRPSYIINVFMYIRMYGLTVWGYWYSIKQHMQTKTPKTDSGSFAFPMYPDVVGCSSFSPHVSSCPSSSTLSSQSPIPTTVLPTTVHQLWSTQQWLSASAGASGTAITGQFAGWGLLATHNVTHRIVHHVF